MSSEPGAGHPNLSWTNIPFGKYQGKSLPQVAFTDPDWLFWAVEKEKFFQSAGLMSQLKDVVSKAQRIKLPVKKYPNSVVEYIIQPSVGKLGVVNVVPADQSIHEGASGSFRRKHFDLSIPRRLANYDKLGAKILIKAIKFYVFESEKVKMTRERCDAFFSDNTNFG